MKKEDVLLVIDMQNVYRQGQPWACRDFDKVVWNVNRIVEEMEKRYKNPQVVLTEFQAPQNPFGTWKDYNEIYAEQNADTWLNALADEMKGLKERYPVYAKSTYSAMTIPEILALARHAQMNGGRLVLTGVVAECCVLWTACAAIDLGCKVIYLTDAVSGFDLAKEQASELMLQSLAPLQCKVMSTEEYLAE